MKRNHIITMASLTSTSLIILILYWLLAYFQIYPHSVYDLLSTQSSCMNTPNIFILHSLDSIEWITLILALVCMVIEMSIFVLLCNFSKKEKEKQMEQSNKFSETISEDETQNQLRKNQIQTPGSSKSMKSQKQQHQNFKKYKLYFLIFFSLIVLSGTIIGHHIKIITAVSELQLCLPNNEIINTIFIDHIILLSLLSYSFISTIVRIILNLFWKKSYTNKLEHLSTQPQLTNHQAVDQQRIKQNEQIVVIHQNSDKKSQESVQQAKNDNKSQSTDRPSLLRKPIRIFSNLRKKLGNSKSNLEIQVLEEKPLPKISSSNFYRKTG